MPDRRQIRGVLFDSGDTLVTPLGGSWFPGHRFHEILEARGVRSLPADRLDSALGAGMQHLDDNLLNWRAQRSMT